MDDSQARTTSNEQEANEDLWQWMPSENRNVYQIGDYSTTETEGVL